MGDVVSGGVYVTVRVSDLVFPDASQAVTVSTFFPGCSWIPLAAQLVVPLAVPAPPRSFAHVIEDTRALSEAVPARFTKLLPVE